MIPCMTIAILAGGYLNDLIVSISDLDSFSNALVASSNRGITLSKSF
jgi:hypothetical protein